MQEILSDLNMHSDLYGNDMDENSNTIESGLGWITKPDKGEFNGKEVILKAKENPKRKLVGFIVDDRMVARHGQEIFSGDEKIGVVTSGSLSPVLNKNIGLAYLNNGFNKTGTRIEIAVRDKRIKATVERRLFLIKSGYKCEVWL